ncbi:MAG: SH3 domain-containing protein [Actinobacteria bacterium]|nr:MAG: SH3 domain-containing protein [Actinomycetota bacterium]
MNHEERIPLSAAGFVFKRIIPWVVLVGMVYYIYTTGQSYLKQAPKEETNLLEVTATAKKVQPKSIGTATVVSETLNFRSKPDTNSPRIDRLTKGTVLTVLAKPKPEWLKVQTAQGRVGYVFSSKIYIKFVPKKK